VKQDKLWLILPLLLVTASLFYFAFNPSYERSFQAKFYYALGDYPTAHTMAKEAFELDPYNRMAATVMTQSQTALKFVDYIDQAKKYSEEIALIAASESISAADRAKMKLMCEVMMESFVKISPIARDGRKIVLDKALLDEARHYYEQFVALHEKITQTL
jgi:tetratricopeptide (TPR) repeat protein